MRPIIGTGFARRDERFNFHFCPWKHRAIFDRADRNRLHACTCTFNCKIQGGRGEEGDDVRSRDASTTAMRYIITGVRISSRGPITF